MTYSEKTFELLVASESISYSSSVLSRDNQGELYLFEFVLKGDGFVEIGSRSYNSMADSYFMIPPNIDNKYWSAPGVTQEKLFFVCRGGLVKSLLKIYRLEESYFVEGADSLIKYFNNMLILAKQYGARKDREAALVFHEFVQAAHLVVYKDDEEPLPPVVQELHKLLDSHLEKKIDFALISKEITYSQAYTVRLFKNTWGNSARIYFAPAYGNCKTAAQTQYLKH